MDLWGQKSQVSMSIVILDSKKTTLTAWDLFREKMSPDKIKALHLRMNNSSVKIKPPKKMKFYIILINCHCRMKNWKKLMTNLRFEFRNLPINLLFLAWKAVLYWTCNKQNQKRKGNTLKLMKLRQQAKRKAKRVAFTLLARPMWAITL